MVIVIDTREPYPYALDGCEVRRAKLDAGDYSLLGHETRVAVERKTKGDAWACVAGERRRFVRCLERLTLIAHPAVVIECSLAAFACPPTYVQRVRPATAVGSFISWSCRYRIPIFWCESRDYAERVTLRFLAAYWKHIANGGTQ